MDCHFDVLVTRWFVHFLYCLPQFNQTWSWFRLTQASRAKLLHDSLVSWWLTTHHVDSFVIDIQLFLRCSNILRAWLCVFSPEIAKTRLLLSTGRQELLIYGKIFVCGWSDQLWLIQVIFLWVWKLLHTAGHNLTWRKIYRRRLRILHLRWSNLGIGSNIFSWAYRRLWRRVRLHSILYSSK